ncbi:hypothetical protein RR46_03924 [Papilio xuthus]|nr:hypothetical protein RR46_03924 [Papilio xuthus]
MAKEEELPLCPTEVNYLPQSLPMHCRMPRHADYPVYPGALPNLTFPPLPPGFQGLVPDKLPQPAPGTAPGAPPRGAPMPMPMPMHVPMMPMPMPAPAAAHKLPVIVMPFYSPDGASKRDLDDTGRHTQRKKKKRIHRKRKPRRHSHTESGTDTSDDEDWSADTHESSSAESDAGWWAGRRSGGRARGRAQSGAGGHRVHRNKKALLHPILQYVTEDGYVIYEKKISKNQANDWLQNKKEENLRGYNEAPKEEDRDKEEENEVVRGVQAGEETHTAILGGENKTKIKSYKNPHRRKSKKASKSKDNDDG